MEEARIDFLKQIGWNYEKLESLGIVSPVTAINCKYKASTTFSDEVSITVSVEEFKGVRLKLSYIMRNTAEKCVCEGTSEHCFLDKNGKIIKLHKEYPDFYHVLTELAGKAAIN
jgi:acyl-CoA thioester hydrolase